MKFGRYCEYTAAMYPSLNNTASESTNPLLASVKSPRPLFFVFLLLGALGPVLYAADLGGTGYHAPLALFVIAEVTVWGLALFFGRRSPSRTR